jgi:16S rRNA (adenine1518-N6/adenine1519-N6)-dimethyltransferase
VARQRLGQHFLGNNGWRKRILDNLRLTPEETWIEIGPGHGEMTKLLVGEGRKIVAIEADLALAEGLRANIDSYPEDWAGVEVVTSDVLQADIGKLVDGSFRVYGSLPYYITSPILQHLFRWADRIASTHIVIQLEVAERIAAEPGRRDYGYLSTLCQFYTKPRIAFHIPPGAFRPPPKVQSALVEMKLPGEGSRLPIANAPEFFDFLQACFAQKRKTLRNNLLGRWTDAEIQKALSDASVRHDARAEQLTLEQFAQIFGGISAR